MGSDVKSIILLGDCCRFIDVVDVIVCLGYWKCLTTSTSQLTICIAPDVWGSWMCMPITRCLLRFAFLLTALTSRFTLFVIFSFWMLGAAKYPAQLLGFDVWCIATSNDTSQRSQTIDLVQKGYSPQFLDQQRPMITVYEWCVFSILFFGWRENLKLCET